MNNAADSDIDLLRISWGEDWTINLSVTFWLIAVGVAATVVVIILRYVLGGSVFRKNYEIDSAELGVGESKLTFKPNVADKTVAYKIWVELSTRKIGLPIDFDDDVIAEIYDSWYSFFSVTRELIKDVPVSKVRNRSTRQIITLSIDVLNLGLRPHLTKWQARFRRWYDHRLSRDPEASLHPQDIQREFPSYEELIADMAVVNDRLIRYRERMNGLVHA